MDNFFLSLLLMFFAEGARGQEVTTNFEIVTLEEDGNDTELACPTWFVPVMDKNEQPSCKCGSEFDGFLRCVEEEKTVSVLACFCVTQNNNGSLYMASCLYTCALANGSEYRELPADPSKLEKELCAPYHRRGPLCSKCANGYAISSFSVYLTCVKCPTSRWLEYFSLTLLPLTIFYFIVLFFRFRATSAWLDAYILFSQIITSPGTSRLLLYRVGNVSDDLTDSFFHPVSYMARILQSVYAVWNLNFFQLMVPPFCLDPSFSALQVIALDYLTAFYPLFLVLISYVILVLHARNFKPLVIIWKPFNKVAIRCRNKIAINRHSVIDSFATFILLSYVKLIYVSSDLVSFAIPKFPSGKSERAIWIYDGSVDYFGLEHVGYGILALCVYVFGVFIPFVFLALYPCKCFQRLFPRLYNKPQIHAFVDCFHGHFKDGTGNTRDFRYFSSFYLSIRFVGLVVTEYVVSGYAVPIGSMLSAGFGGMILVVKPYKKDLHNTCNGILLLIMSMWLMSQSLYHFPISNVTFYHTIAVVLDFFLCMLPFLYFMFLVLRYIRYQVRKTMCVDRIKYSVRDMRQSKKRTRELSTIKERAYSFPDRVVNPKNYETSMSTTNSSKNIMSEESSVCSRSEVAEASGELTQESLEESVVSNDVKTSSL